MPQLLAGQELLDDDPRPGRPEGAIDEHVTQRRRGLGVIGTDPHALSRRQAIGFHH